MKIGHGVEWTSHACILLATLPSGWSLSAEALADYHEIPAAYMAKQMQLLSRAGLVTSKRGKVGGYSLAKPADSISLWDITAAIEGVKPSFQCSEIRQNGPCGAKPADCKLPCDVAKSFYDAEAAFRASLSGVSIADLVATVAGQGTAEKAAEYAAWIQENASKPAEN